MERDVVSNLWVKGEQGGAGDGIEHVFFAFRSRFECVILTYA